MKEGTYSPRLEKKRRVLSGTAKLQQSCDLITPGSMHSKRQVALFSLSEPRQQIHHVERMRRKMAA